MKRKARRRRRWLAARRRRGRWSALVVGVAGRQRHVRRRDPGADPAAAPRGHHPPAGREKDVDAALIAAVIYSESKFSDQTSSAGARGLMQITPEAANEIERHSGGTTFKLDDLSDPEINIRYGTFLLRELLDRYDGDEVAALAAYNAGPGNADKWGGSDLTVDDIPFPETRAYVEEVLEKQRRLPRQVREGAGLLMSDAPRPRVAALALAVGLVLADSSIVVLALPEIYRELDTSVAGVTWVLVSFNLVMALAAVPAAHLARRVGPGRAAAVGLAIFAGAGLACGARRRALAP